MQGFESCPDLCSRFSSNLLSSLLQSNKVKAMSDKALSITQIQRISQAVLLEQLTKHGLSVDGSHLAQRERLRNFYHPPIDCPAVDAGLPEAPAVELASAVSAAIAPAVQLAVLQPEAGPDVQAAVRKRLRVVISDPQEPPATPLKDAVVASESSSGTKPPAKVRRWQPKPAAIIPAEDCPVAGSADDLMVPARNKNRKPISSCWSFCRLRRSDQQLQAAGELKRHKAW